jgi:hypothetical protein
VSVVRRRGREVAPEDREFLRWLTDPGITARERALQRRRDARDRQRATLRRLAEAVLRWHHDHGTVTALASLAEEILQLHGELAAAQRQRLEAASEAERQGYRRGFTRGRRNTP